MTGPPTIWRRSPHCRWCICGSDERGLRLLRRRPYRHPRGDGLAKAANVEEIGIALRAGTKCGTCLPELRSIVDTMTVISNTRTPSEARPPRMAPLARLPVFFALDGKRAVVAGGTPAAAWKAELLSAAGAAVDVYASRAVRGDARARGRAAARHDRHSSPRLERGRHLAAPRSRSARSRTTTKPRASPRRRARPACRST